MDGVKLIADITRTGTKCVVRSTLVGQYLTGPEKILWEARFILKLLLSNIVLRGQTQTQQTGLLGQDASEALITHASTLPHQ